MASSRDIALTENVAPQIQGRAARPKAVVYVLKIVPAPAGASPNIVAPPTTAATSNHQVTTPIEKCTVRKSFHHGRNVSSRLLPEQQMIHLQRLQSRSCRFQHRQLVRTGRCLHTHVYTWSTDGSLTFAQHRRDSPPLYGYITLSEARLAYYPPRSINGQTSSTVTDGLLLTSSIYLRSCAEYGCFPIFRLTSAHVAGRSRRPKLLAEIRVIALEIRVISQQTLAEFCSVLYGGILALAVTPARLTIGPMHLPMWNHQCRVSNGNLNHGLHSHWPS